MFSGMFSAPGSFLARQKMIERGCACVRIARILLMPRSAAELRGDASANEMLDRLYRVQAPRLLRLFGERVGREAAPDLVQESFLRLSRRQSQPPPVENPAGYLITIAHNLLRNPGEVARRRMLRDQVTFDEALFGGCDPGPALEARDMLARLDQAVLGLKPKTRAIFLAHRVEGLSYAQIAERTGLSVKGVEKQMSKALSELDRLIHR